MNNQSYSKSKMFNLKVLMPEETEAKKAYLVKFYQMDGSRNFKGFECIVRPQETIRRGGWSCVN